MLWEGEVNMSVSALAVSPDGGYLAVGGFNGLVQVFNRSFDVVWEERLGQSVRSLSLSTRGERLLASTGAETRLYEGGGVIWEAGEGFVKSASLSGNGRGVAYSVLNSLTYVDTVIKGGKGVYTYQLGSVVESVSSFATSSYRVWLAAAGDQRGVELYSRDGFLWRRELDERVSSIALSRDGKVVAAGTESGVVHLFDKAGALKWSVRTSWPVSSLSVSREGGYTLVGGEGGAALIDSDGRVIWSYNGGERVVLAALSAGGNRLAIAAGNKLQVYNVPELKPPFLELTSPVEGEEVSGVLEVNLKTSWVRALSIKLDGREVARRPFKLDTTLLSNGWHRLSAVAEGFSGEVLVEEASFKVENKGNIPPPVKLLTPREAEVISGVQRVYGIINIPFEDLELSVDGEPVSTELPFDWNTRSYGEGAHTLALTVRRLGRVYTDKLLVFVDNQLDSPSPAVSILQPSSGERLRGKTAVRAFFEEKPSEVYVAVDGEIVSNTLPYVWDTSLVEPGRHEIAVYALDDKGDVGVAKVTAVVAGEEDVDGDGWSSELERLYHTDPENSDSDSDGIVDSLDPDPLRDYTALYLYLNILLILLFLSTLVVKHVDLRLNLLLTLLALVFTSIEPYRSSPLRIPLALYLIFLAPGHSFISALFPRKAELSIVERLTLAVAFSIAIFVFNGFALNYTWGFKTLPIVVSVSGVTLAFTVMAGVLRSRLPVDERFTLELKVPTFPSTPYSDVEKALVIALVLSIFIASAMLVYAKATFKHERFTALYILGEDGRAEAYPKTLYLGYPVSMIVGVENYERAPARYRLEVRLGGRLQAVELFSLRQGEKWLKRVSFTPNVVAERAKLEFQLYKDEDPNIYRSVHLWVSSKPNLAAPESLERYSLKALPVIENQDFELGSLGWTFTSTVANSSGAADNITFLSPPYSYRLAMPGGSEDEYAGVSQEVGSREPGLALLSFTVLDSYRGGGGGRYLLQVLVNDQVVWSRDAADTRGWERHVAPVMLEQGWNTIALRVVQKAPRANGIKVWWDDLKLVSSDSIMML